MISAQWDRQLAILCSAEIIYEWVRTAWVIDRMRDRASVDKFRGMADLGLPPLLNLYSVAAFLNMITFSFYRNSSRLS